MNGKEDEVDVVENDEIEPSPDAGGTIMVPATENIDDLIHVADRINEVIEAQNKIRMALLRLAQTGDWFRFKSESGDKADVGFAGSLRIASTMGVSFLNWQSEKITGRDEKGEWYRWEFECDSEWRGRRARVYGRASSRDMLFGVKNKEFRPLYEVNEGNIKMAGRRACMKEGVKVLFGLHHMNPPDLEKSGITLIDAGGYTFKSTDQKAEDIQTAEIDVANITLKKGKNNNGKEWTKYKIVGVDGREFSTFSETDAKIAKDAKAAGKLVRVYYTVSKYGNDASKVEIFNDEQIEGLKQKMAAANG